jgi:hypothetical protein
VVLQLRGTLSEGIGCCHEDSGEYVASASCAEWESFIELGGGAKGRGGQLREKLSAAGVSCTTSWIESVIQELLVNTGAKKVLRHKYLAMFFSLNLRALPLNLRDSSPESLWIRTNGLPDSSCHFP